MFQGFYMATSGMLTQNRNLNVISNNMGNVSTPGFRSDRYMATTFHEELMSRIGNKDKSSYSPLGTTSKIRASEETVTDFSTQYYAPTRSALDFALSGEGWFCIQGQEGTVYTRDGSFTLDDQGYLYLPPVGRVLGENGPIRVTTDDLSVNSTGEIFSAEDNTYFGTLRIVNFANPNEQLIKSNGNVFVAPNGGAVDSDAKVVNYALEGSNVDAVAQMVAMMSGQRALQSSSQVLKMYDTLMGKIVSQLGLV